MQDPRIRLATALADRYRFERELGQGGMATVYLAQDLRHHRQVAIKLMRPELAAVIGAERFLSEIRTTANLQHPHILPLFDSGEADGVLYYAMPFVEGESLRERLVREKQLPIGDAVRIASEVASALDYAHRHGVIHRDIKPENILLHDGSALVADFGIALAASKAGGTRITETGMSVGTPHYMSPEQAMGEREITARSDIYALGAITYEMLIGEPPFSGPTAQAIVAKVLTEEPRPLIPRRRSIPAEVEAAVLTALEKLPADRFGSAHEFAASLTAEQTGRRTGARARPARAAVPSWRRWAVLAAGLGLLAGAYLLGSRRTGAAALPMTFGSTAKVTWDPVMEVLPAISPDGKTVAYAKGSPVRMRVFVRPVSGGRDIALTDDTTEVQSHPRWSPDGSRVLFLERGGVVSVPATGGPETAEVPPSSAGPVISAAWSPDGRRIAYVVGDSVFVHDARGDSRGLARVYEGHGCAWSPDAAYLACTSGNAIALTPGALFGNASPSRVVTVRVRDGRVVPLTDSLFANLSPAWSPDGRWVYYLSNRYGPRDIFAQAVGDGAPSGPALRLTTGLNAHTISLSADGRRLAYGNLEVESGAWSVPIPAHPPVPSSSAIQLTRGSQFVETTILSRDGRWLYFDSDLSGNMDLYRMAIPNGAPERLTTDSSDDFWPEPSPDGREVAFHSWRGGSRDIYVMPLDGGPIQRVTTSPAQDAMASWSPDGNRLAWAIFTGRGGVWTARRASRGAPWQQPMQRLDWGFAPTWSPDGQTLAFSSSLTWGSLWLMPADSGAPRLLADTTGPRGVQGDLAQWSDDGRFIYTRSTDSTGTSFWRVPLGGGAPERLMTFQGGERSSGGWSAAGGRLAYTVFEARSDVWVMEVRTR
ncbi:MAG TPA: protein kinase [Gemmatimonadales bacterium]|nr:protein kinase [Gemmatimonadales bacterium]